MPVSAPEVGSLGGIEGEAILLRAQDRVAAGAEAAACLLDGAVRLPDVDLENPGMPGPYEVASGLERHAETDGVDHGVGRGAARVLGEAGQGLVVSRAEHQLVAGRALMQRVVGGGEGHALPVERDGRIDVVSRRSHRSLQGRMRNGLMATTCCPVPDWTARVKVSVPCALARGNEVSPDVVNWRIGGVCR